MDGMEKRRKDRMGDRSWCSGCLSARDPRGIGGNSCKRQVRLHCRPIGRWLRCSAFLPFKEGKRATVAGRENVSRESEAVELCPRVMTTTR